MSAAAPVASVIVALNPHDNDLARLFRAFDAQAAMHGDFELLVVDGGARDGVEAACAAHSRRHPGTPLRYVRAGPGGRAAANNAGVAHARACTLIFAADDFIPSVTLVRAHVDFQRALRRPGVGIGPAYFAPECAKDAFRRWLEESGRLFGVPFRTAAVQWPRQFFYVGNASLSRRTFEHVGGFDERFEHDLQDDLDFGRRLEARGIRTHLVPAAVAWHDHALTVDERLTAMRRAGRAARELEARAPGFRPWAAIVDQPLDGLADCAARLPGGEATPQASADYYRALVDLAFVAGYLDAGGPPR